MPSRRSDEERAVYIISVAAELAGVHPQTLRIYERKGLVEPARTTGNTRRYSRRDISLLQEIQHLTQDEGINLAGVAKIITLRKKLESAQRRIRQLEEEVESLCLDMEEAVAATHRKYRHELVLYQPPQHMVPRRPN